MVGVYDPLDHLLPGVYLVHVIGRDFNKAFKFIKNKETPVASVYASNSSLKKAAFKSGENYKISWSGDGIVSGEQNVTVVDGNSNDFNIPVTLLSNEWGNLTLGLFLKGYSEYGTIVTVTNMQTPDSTYTKIANEDYADFEGVYVADEHNPTQYKIEVIDSDPDPHFLKTTEYVDVSQGTSFTSKLINLDEIPNVVDITTTVYKSRDVSSRVPNQTVYLVRDSDNAIVDTQTTDSNGAILFDDVPGNIVYHLVNEGAGTYKKTNGSFRTADVDRMSEREAVLNTTAVYILQDDRGLDIPANIIQLFKPTAENTEIEQHIYFPPMDGGNQIYKDQAKEFASLLGASVVATDTPFPSNPTADQIAEYHPGPYDKNKDTTIFGINILNYAGGSASTDGKFLPNGNPITFYGDMSLGGLEARFTHHEMGNTYNFPQVNGNDSDFKTSRESNAAQIYTLQESRYDIPVMSEWIINIINQYDKKDSNNIPIEYNKTTKIE